MAPRAEALSAHVQSRRRGLSQSAHPWAFPAVSVTVLSLTLLSYDMRWDSVIQLLPEYIAAHLLIRACIFGPVGKLPSVWQSMAFLQPDVLLVPLALLDLGFWAGRWLLGLPAWG